MAMTILLVDDEEDIRVSFRRYLRSSMPDARLVTAATGPEGLMVLAREPVDVVLSDFRMPGMDGLAFLTAAARLQPQAVRALVTAYEDPKLGALERSNGTVDAFLKKPLEPINLLPLITGLVRDRMPQAA